ncbi:MAG: DUF86 domain-containing protein [Elusimicrobiota bacterium]
MKNKKNYLEMDYENFLKDDKTVNTVVRKLEIIGEATKNIPISIKQKYDNVNWKGMAGMRDKLIHNYSGVDIEILWKVVKKDIADIKPKIKEIFEKLDSEK